MSVLLSWMPLFPYRFVLILAVSVLPPVPFRLSGFGRNPPHGSLVLQICWQISGQLQFQFWTIPFFNPVQILSADLYRISFHSQIRSVNSRYASAFPLSGMGIVTLNQHPAQVCNHLIGTCISALRFFLCTLQNNPLQPLRDLGIVNTGRNHSIL